MTTEERAYFRLCSSCRKQLGFGSGYFACSVSTCNRARDPLTFCSVACFEAHVPVVRHREAWAEERRAPTRGQWQHEQDPARKEAEERVRKHQAGGAATQEPRERRVIGATSGAGQDLLVGEPPSEILIVVSKLKSYVRARSGMNTSDGVVEVLSDIVRELCDRAIEQAAKDGRKTVMDRDF
jgi:hypothetical protein